jgi:hypothetical protein
MMKKICGLLLAAVMLVLILPDRALAASGVDLSRIKFSSGTEPLTFKFGGISIDGEVRQEYPFSKGEISKLVQETLKAKGLTELDIQEANQKVDKAKKASEFTQADIDRIKENLMTSAGVVPQAGDVVTILKVVDTYMKSKSWDDIGTASAALMEDNMKEWVKSTATGFVDQAGELGENVNKANEWIGKLTAIQQFCEMMMNEQDRTQQKWTDIADGANAKRLLNDFYYALQEKIDAYKQKSDEKGWVIDFNQAMDGRNFTFFGVDSNYQTWYLDMHMVQKTTNEFGSVAGEYEGEFSITAENEMSSFTSRANEAVKKMPIIADAITKIQADGFTVSLTTTSQGTAYISRTISGTCKATIQQSGEISISLDEQKDETQVAISGMAVAMDCKTPSAIITSGGTFTYEFGATDEDLKIVKGSADLSAKAPNFDFSQNFSGSGGISVGWDEEIWKPWEGTEKTLKHAEN